MSPSQAPKTAISPTRAENYAEWYQQIVRASDMAELSGVRGCMIIKPNGERKWRPEWTGPKRFKYAGNLITREIDGNPTKTAWVFAGGADRSYGTMFKIYCVVPLPPGV